MEQTNMIQADSVKDDLIEVQELLTKHRLIGEVAHRQNTIRKEVVDNLVQRQHVAELRRLLARMPTVSVTLILNALSDEDRLVVWKELAEDRLDDILELLSDEIRKDLVDDGHQISSRVMVNIFELNSGRLQQTEIKRPQELADCQPIWVDLVAPTPKVREWIGKHYGLELPDPENLTDLEASARFYIEDNGEVHLHSDFLLDLNTESRNVAVAFILHKETLFSVRSEELPVFRLQRMRARTQPGYVTDGTDVLLDLYAADAEYSADRLEDVYAELELVGKKVLSTRLSDEEAGDILSDIARQEDLNGRIRRNVLDTRRALSFLVRSHLLTVIQGEDSRQILRDIESLDSHTSFLFGKINFLMDAVVGFININQNQRVSKLTTLSIIFMPINILAGMGGMSEFSMMTTGIPWEYAYSGFTFAMVLVGWLTYLGLSHHEKRVKITK